MSAIRAGDWVIVSTVEDGDVDCRCVSKVTENKDEYPIATLTDGSQWVAETGEPLSRVWRGHVIRVETDAYLCNRLKVALETLMREADSDIIAELYGHVLRAVKR